MSWGERREDWWPTKPGWYAFEYPGHPWAYLHHLQGHVKGVGVFHRDGSSTSLEELGAVAVYTNPVELPVVGGKDGDTVTQPATGKEALG